MGISIHNGPEIRRQYMMILVVGTPKKATSFRKPPDVPPVHNANNLLFEGAILYPFH